MNATTGNYTQTDITPQQSHSPENGFPRRETTQPDITLQKSKNPEKGFPGNPTDRTTTLQTNQNYEN